MIDVLSCLRRDRPILAITADQAGSSNPDEQVRRRFAQFDRQV